MMSVPHFPRQVASRTSCRCRQISDKNGLTASRMRMGVQSRKRRKGFKETGAVMHVPTHGQQWSYIIRTCIVSYCLPSSLARKKEGIWYLPSRDGRLRSLCSGGHAVASIARRSCLGNSVALFPCRRHIRVLFLVRRSQAVDQRAAGNERMGEDRRLGTRSDSRLGVRCRRRDGRLQ
jgi:hypothetical protein